MEGNLGVLLSSVIPISQMRENAEDLLGGGDA